MDMKIFAILLWCTLICSAYADYPATEFFVVDTAKLTKLVSDDSSLDKATSVQLQAISLAHGHFKDGTQLAFSTSTFRIDARLSRNPYSSSEKTESVAYNICASNVPSTWSIVATSGNAIKLGNQFITQNWRKEPITVVLRFLNLKQ